MPVNGEARPLFCAQIVSKNHQEYQNISKDIEIHRNPKPLENVPQPGDFYYYLHISFVRRFLHTVEVRGSSPLSPTTFVSTTCDLNPESWSIPDANFMINDALGLMESRHFGLFPSGEADRQRL
jgi:hypothetical protein